MKETVYARRSQWYAGNHVNFGEAFEVSKNDAVILVALKRAQREPIASLQAKPTETPKDEESKPVGSDYASMDKDALREAYKSVFGRPAHGRMAEESLREELEKAKAEANASEN